MADTAVLDVDGTLVDTNYQHALAWFRALRRYDVTVPLWVIHRHIGMGGDQFVPAVAGQRVEDEHGDDLRQAWVEEFDPFLEEIVPFEGAADLLAELRDRGFRVVLATSGKPHHVEHFLDLVDGRRYAQDWTTSDDVERTKPEPDLLEVAIGKVDGARAVMVGDSTWDFEAARSLDVPGIALHTGGFSPEELRAAGAGHVFDSLVELREHLDGTPLGKPS